jgi:hypothetical protein
VADVIVGWDGKCAQHRTTPSIARPTGRDVRCDVTRGGLTKKAFCRVVLIHCAAGHEYECIDVDDDMIEDPFTMAETSSILRGEINVPPTEPPEEIA